MRWRCVCKVPLLRGRGDSSRRSLGEGGCIEPGIQRTARQRRMRRSPSTPVRRHTARAAGVALRRTLTVRLRAPPGHPHPVGLAPHRASGRIVIRRCVRPRSGESGSAHSVENRVTGPVALRIAESFRPKLPRRKLRDAGAGASVKGVAAARSSRSFGEPRRCHALPVPEPAPATVHLRALPPSYSLRNRCAVNPSVPSSG